MNNFIEPQIYFKDFLPNNKFKGNSIEQKKYLLSIMQQFPLYPLIYFSEEPNKNNFEILTAYQEINNDLLRLEKLKDYILLYNNIYIEGFKNSKKINKNTYGIQSDKSILKLPEGTNSLPSDPEEFDLSNSGLANEMINLNFPSNSSNKKKQYFTFQGFVNNFIENNGIYDGYQSKYPLFFKLFDENFEDETQETKIYLRKIFMQYVKLRKKIFESMKLYNGIMAFQYLFDFNMINERMNSRSSFVKNLDASYNLGKNNVSNEKKRRNYKNVKMIQYMNNDIRNLKNFSEEKAVEHPENIKGTFKIQESNDLYNNTIPFQSIYNNQLDINTKYLTYILIYQNNLKKDSGNFSVLFKNSFLLDYYTILLCFNFVQPVMFKTFISFDEKIRQNDIAKRFGLFNEFMYDFKEWKDKFISATVAGTEIQKSIYPKEDQFINFMQEYLT